MRLYSEFLTHVRQRYGSEYWAALPREVARYCRDFQPIRPHTQVAAATEKVGVPELVRDPVVARNSLAKAG